MASKRKTNNNNENNPVTVVGNVTKQQQQESTTSSSLQNQNVSGIEQHLHHQSGDSDEQEHSCELQDIKTNDHDDTNNNNVTINKNEHNNNNLHTFASSDEECLSDDDDDEDDSSDEDEDEEDDGDSCEEGEDDSFTIHAVDGPFYVDIETALLCSALRKQLMNDPNNRSFTITNVTKRSLKKVFDWCRFHCPQKKSSSSSKKKKKKNILSRKPVIDLSARPSLEHRKQYDKALVDAEPSDLCELASASYYLQIRPLVDLTCQSIATLIKGKTPEEVRETFNITNDFNPEEEAAIAAQAATLRLARGGSSNNAPLGLPGHPPFPPKSLNSKSWLTRNLPFTNNPEMINKLRMTDPLSMPYDKMAEISPTSKTKKKNQKKKKKKAELKRKLNGDKRPLDDLINFITADNKSKKKGKKKERSAKKKTSAKKPSPSSGGTNLSSTSNSNKRESLSTKSAASSIATDSDFDSSDNETDDGDDIGSYNSQFYYSDEEDEKMARDETFDFNSLMSRIQESSSGTADSRLSSLSSSNNSSNTLPHSHKNSSNSSSNSDNNNNNNNSDHCLDLSDDQGRIAPLKAATIAASAPTIVTSTLETKSKSSSTNSISSNSSKTNNGSSSNSKEKHNKIISSEVPVEVPKSAPVSVITTIALVNNSNLGEESSGENSVVDEYTQTVEPIIRTQSPPQQQQTVYVENKYDDSSLQKRVLELESALANESLQKKQVITSLQDQITNLEKVVSQQAKQMLSMKQTLTNLYSFIAAQQQQLQQAQNSYYLQPRTSPFHSSSDPTQQSQQTPFSSMFADSFHNSSVGPVGGAPLSSPTSTPQQKLFEMFPSVSGLVGHSGTGGISPTSPLSSSNDLFNGIPPQRNPSPSLFSSGLSGPPGAAMYRNQ